IGKMPAKGLGHCDYVSGAAHKFGGPRGVGFLKVPHKSKVHSLLFGGKQERGQRAGTENIPIISPCWPRWNRAKSKWPKATPRRVLCGRRSLKSFSSARCPAQPSSA